MPTLLGKHEFLDKPLQFKFDLLKAENPTAWEGWLEYRIELYNGDELVTKLDDRVTIIDGDVGSLCEFLTNNIEGHFEPMEPDFKLVKILSQFPGENSTELFIVLDEGIRRSKGYTGNGIGFCLSLNSRDLKEFTSALNSQYQELVKNLQRIP